MNQRDTVLRKDGAVTYRRILEAAGKLYAEKGMAETKNKAIAALAEVDLASINYHFGSRAGLYQQTLIAAHAHFIDQATLAELYHRDIPTKAKFEQFIALLTDAVLSPSSWHAKLIARELLSPSSSLSVLMSDEVMPKFTWVRKIIGEVSGIPADSDAILPCVISIVAPCLMMLVVSEEVPGPMKFVRAMDKQTLQDYLNTFAYAGLQATGAQYQNRAPKS